VTQQPFKIPFYAALLRLLHDADDESVSPDTPSLGKRILEEFWKAFQAIVDKLAWREARLCVRLPFVVFALKSSS
jgi:nuclear cap-binding protein subunit 1